MGERSKAGIEEAGMSVIAKDWIDAAVAITPGFEATGDPYEAVSGDFDGMGISCGALQWNIGQRSLQPMVVAVGQTRVSALMPTYGPALWTACKGSTTAALATVRSWQKGKKLNAVAAKELRALMGSPEMRAEQSTRINAVAKTAFAMAEGWRGSTPGSKPSKRLFCWFFDLVTQNGGLEGLTPAAVEGFIKGNTPDKVDDLICDFLATRKGTSGHVKDAHANAVLWRNPDGAEKLELLCMSYLRSKTANPLWRHVVVNRKGTIAMGAGHVNGKKWALSVHGL
jgi:hypothetical protein